MKKKVVTLLGCLMIGFFAAKMVQADPSDFPQEDDDGLEIPTLDGTITISDPGQLGTPIQLPETPTEVGLPIGIPLEPGQLGTPIGMPSNPGELGTPSIPGQLGFPITPGGEGTEIPSPDGENGGWTVETDTNNDSEIHSETATNDNSISSETACGNGTVLKDGKCQTPDGEVPMVDKGIETSDSGNADPLLMSGSGCTLHKDLNPVRTHAWNKMSDTARSLAF